jgi:hypothetical protein
LAIQVIDPSFFVSSKG